MLSNEIEMIPIEELVEDRADIKKIIEETEDFHLDYSMPKGDRGGDGKMGGGFTSARGGGNVRGETLLPAELNFDTVTNSLSEVLSRFQNKYGSADREYAISVDEQGFVHQHIKGGKVSVPIAGGKGEMIIHNHPNGSNFSKADLISTASTQEKGIIATSSDSKTKGTYTFRKTDKFKAKEFIKAVNKAKWPTKYSYNEGADWWLRKNQKTYGYTYSAKGRSKGSN